MKLVRRVKNSWTHKRYGKMKFYGNYIFLFSGKKTKKKRFFQLESLTGNRVTNFSSPEHAKKYGWKVKKIKCA